MTEVADRTHRAVPPFDPFADMAWLLSGFPVGAIVDGGAYIGTISARLTSAFPRARVYAFEPQNESFRALEALAERNPRVSPRPYALGAVTGSASLHVGLLPYTSSLLGRPRDGRRYYPAEAILDRTRQVHVVSLDDWVREEGLGGVDLIKLDLQGYELQALSGAQHLLQSSVQLVYLEVSFVPLYENTCLFHDVAMFLANLGFTLYRLYDLHFADNGQLVYGDAIFVSQQVRVTILA
jgi:FkbM family methyltransferase